MRRSFFLFLVCRLAAAQGPDGGPPPARWATELEIIRLACAIDLADFPIKQKDLPRQLPLPPYQAYAGGKSARQPEGSVATIYSLTDPSRNAGFYALRTVVKWPPGGPKDASEQSDLEVTSAELLFICQPSIWLSVAALSPHKQGIESMRTQMQKEKLTPREFLERRSEKHPELEVYYQSLLTEKKPNQSPEPTRGSAAH